MKIKINIAFIILMSNLCFAQLTQIKSANMYSEVPIFNNEKGEMYSTLVTFQFSKMLIDLPKGQTSFQEDKIIFPTITNLLNDLRVKYGQLSIIKAIPDASWGDTLKVNKRTNKMVTVPDFSQVYKITFEKPVPIDSVTNLIKKIPYVLFAEGPNIAYTTLSPNDPWYQDSGNQWSYNAINASRAWDITTGSSNVRVGINDLFGGLGVSQIHQELTGKVAWDSVGGDYGNHGIICAGVVGALTNNNQGIASLGWNTSVMLDPYGSAEAIKSLVDHGADVINFSWISGYSTLISNAILSALRRGVVCVAAAGNNETPLPGVRYPACYNFGSDGQVIAVSATILNSGTEQFLDSFNYSPGTDPVNDPTNAFIDFAAPGANYEALSGVDATGYVHIWSGTSISAPFVSALIGLMYSVNNSLTPNQVYGILKATTDKVDQSRHQDNSNGWNQYLGYGRINAYAALKYTLEYYGGTVTQNITIPSSETWTFQPGVTVNFTNGVQLIVNGTLTANGGSASTPILFNFTSPNSSTQNGIVFNSGSSGTINYCQIRNAYRGIYENNITVNITNSAISGCTDGIYLYNSGSHPLIQGCNIYNNSNAGVNLLYSPSSTVIKEDSIHNNYDGLYCSSYSQPTIGNSSTQHGNNILNNDAGIICFNSANPMIGNSSTAGYNNLVNSDYNVLNTTGNTIYAYHNWWGTTNPTYFKSGGALYTSYLSAFQTGIPHPLLSKTSGNLAATVNGDIPMLAELDNAYELTASNNLAQARTVCLNLINNYPDYSVSYNALNLLQETYSDNELSSKKDIYNSIFNNKVKKDLYATAGLILANIDKENKLKHIDDVINNYTGQAVIEFALFDKFVFYYFEKQNRDNSLSISKELDALFPLSRAAIEAHKILGDMEYYKININNEKALQKTTNLTPTDYALVGNYPNPFNPTTRINYQLPKGGFVTLKVYDILGREVASLVNENQQAGSYSVPFDASKLSSGIYIYTIRANDFIQSKKMNLVK